MSRSNSRLSNSGTTVNSRDFVIEQCIMERFSRLEFSSRVCQICLVNRVTECRFLMFPLNFDGSVLPVRTKVLESVEN